MLPVLRPLPQPHLAWLQQLASPVAEVWRSYLESLDQLLRALKGIEASATYDPAELANGSAASTNMSVPGAAAGDFVQAAFTQPLQGILLMAWVVSADTVRVRFQNNTGTTINLSEGTLRVRVTKA